MRPLQRKAVEFILDVKTAALFFKQRLGKSWITLGAIEKIEPDYSLLVVPLQNKETTWVELIDRLLDGYTCFQDIDDFIAARKLGKKKIIMLVHFQLMVSIIKKLKKIPWDFITIDETQGLKDRTSRQSKAAALLWDCEYKVILTGTPLEHRPQDAWAQFRFLAPDVFGTRWKNFEDEYITPPSIDIEERLPDGRPKYPKGSIRWRTAMMKIGMERKKRKMIPEKLPKFVRLIKPFSWREDLPSPEPNFIKEKVRMWGYQRRIYDQLNDAGVVRLRDRTRIVAELNVVKKEKLHQICGGYLIDEDGETHHIGDAKMGRLKHIIKKNGSPFVVFCQYRAEVLGVVKGLGRRHRIGVLSGMEKDRAKRAKVQTDFQSGKLDGVVCQTRTGGVGIDLFRAKYIVVYSTTHSWIDFDQLVARIRLPEQTDPVNVFLLVMSQSVDEEKRSMIVAKDRETEKVLSRLKRN